MSLRDQLKKLNVGMNRKGVSLSPPNSNWFKAFTVADTTLRKQIPADLDLHHIGSTSIPNIHAKPILDILGVVPSIEAFDSRRADMEALGFVWKGEYGIANRRYCVLYDESEEIGLIHLHVFAKTDHEVARHLVFRDYLRASPEASSRYEELKIKLADTHTGARTNYSEGKAELIAQLLSEAFEWKKFKIAIHEIGHAVMALFRGRGVLKVSLKGMDSPSGTDRYHGFTTLEPIDQSSKVTDKDALRSVMISLGGYASEILFFEVCTPGGDDLTTAAKWAECLRHVEGYSNQMASLPVPEPGPLDKIQNPQVRAYVHHMIPECARALDRLGPLIKFLAEELYKKDELAGDDIEAHFNSFMQTRLGADEMK